MRWLDRTVTWRHRAGASAPDVAAPRASPARLGVHRLWGPGPGSRTQARARRAVPTRGGAALSVGRGGRSRLGLRRGGAAARLEPRAPAPPRDGAHAAAGLPQPPLPRLLLALTRRGTRSPPPGGIPRPPAPSARPPADAARPTRTSAVAPSGARAAGHGDPRVGSGPRRGRRPRALARPLCSLCPLSFLSLSPPPLLPPLPPFPFPSRAADTSWADRSRYRRTRMLHSARRRPPAGPGRAALSPFFRLEGPRLFPI
jgi:hypothetical protein